MDGKCTSLIRINGTVKIQIDIYPDSNPEYALLNLLKEHVDFERDDLVEIIVKKKGVSPLSNTPRSD